MAIFEHTLKPPCLGIKKIVITGGPATGKTSIINGLEARDHKCFHEIIRELTSDAKDAGKLGSLTTNPINSVSDPLAFNTKLLEGRKRQFLQANKSREPLTFFDRGIHDVLAYMDYYEQPHPSEFIEVAEEHRYDLVFLLPMWREIFRNDEERFESFEEALKIEKHICMTYQHFGNIVIEVPHVPVKQRIEFMLNTIVKN